MPLSTSPFPLFGRDRDLRLLHEQFAAALAGRGSIVLIGGEAGIGKTSLAEALCQEAVVQGARLLTGRCFDLTDTPPYGPWVELFARFHGADGDPPLPAAFTQPGTVGEVTSQAKLIQQVLDFFIALSARRPLILLLDDIHWADPASLDLLRVLARSIAQHPLLLLVVYRTDEPMHRRPLDRLLPLLVREAPTTRLTPLPLEPEDIAALVRTRFALPDADTARLAAYLVERTEGNPFFISEVLQTLEEGAVLRRTDGCWTLGQFADVGVPLLLRQVIDARIARFDAESQRLLGIAAVIGADVPLSVWTAVGDVDEEVLLGLIERGEEARLLLGKPDGESVRFAHALIRETLHGGIASVRRRRLHRRTGEVLTALPHPDPDAVAYHFERSHDSRAATWLLEAGERAEFAYAYRTAADRFERALVLMDATGSEVTYGWLLVRLAALHRARDPHRALAYLEAAWPYRAADPALAAYALTLRGQVRCIASRIRDGLIDMEAGVRAVQGRPEEVRASAAVPICVRVGLEGDGETTLIFWLAVAGRVADARARGEALIAANRDGETGARHPLGDAYSGLGWAYAVLGKPEQARAAFARALGEYRLLGNHRMAWSVSREYIHRVWFHYQTDDVATRQRATVESDRDRERMAGNMTPEDAALYARLRQVEGDFVGGEWQAVRDLAPTLLAAPALTGLEASARICLAQVLRFHGERDAAWELVREALPEGPETEPGNTSFPWARALQEVGIGLALDESDLTQARAWLEAHDYWLAWSGAVPGVSEGQALWAEFARQAGDAEQARIHAERALFHALEPGSHSRSSLPIASSVSWKLTQDSLARQRSISLPRSCWQTLAMPLTSAPSRCSPGRDCIRRQGMSPRRRPCSSKRVRFAGPSARCPWSHASTSLPRRFQWRRLPAPSRRTA